MRIVIQRAKRGKVLVNNEVVGAIEKGFVLLVGVTHDDEEKDVEYLADKIVNLRIFEDEEGKMNLSLLDVNGSILSISQFTLYGDARKGRRPNFMNAAKPDKAKQCYERLNQLLREKGAHVETGLFGEMMEVDFINDGPVTIILES
ncbi:D-aminoacyl-tRNA deacylase [Tepidibacillus fermentans]|uniref:D-aminoacyl-tRNA deacylase n=1 Tax=Tepidibacillus fermentans TaxID=1281767 RepID=A0A4R3KJH9_9BACI|nr:D-aminoacyl-tRNA deacylase [Tepidibacillus fermentans]TCS83828.1 D-tyrosyl-tRNA(Tyr) deacylase [Tepidibacillus fermentans]